jgi:hypothetical protein
MSKIRSSQDPFVSPDSNPLRQRRCVSTSTRVSLMFVFLLASAFPVMATDPCQPIKDQLTRLQQEYQNAKSSYQPRNDESGDHRHPVIGGLRRVENEYRPRIQAKQREYDQCRIDHGGKPDQPATLTGSASMTTTNSNARGPFNRSITIGLKFLKFDHRTVGVSSFPSMSVTFNTPAGSNTTTISLTSVGSTTVNPTNGRMTISLTLHFAQSLMNHQDSDLFIELSTENPAGSRINRSNRQVTLAGTGTFRDGFLDGSDCTLVISGTLSALPALP